MRNLGQHESSVLHLDQSSHTFWILYHAAVPSIQQGHQVLLNTSGNSTVGNSYSDVHSFFLTFALFKSGATAADTV